MVEPDLANCPSVASRQNTLLGVARRSPAQKQTANTSFTWQRSESFNSRDEPEDGQSDSVDGPETDGLIVVQSDCQEVLRDGLSVREKEPGDVLSNDRDEPKRERQEDQMSNSQEVQEVELLDCVDGPDSGVSDPRNSTEKPEDDPEPGCQRSVSEDITERAPSNYGAVPDNNYGTNVDSADDSVNAGNELLVSESTDDSLTLMRLPSDTDG